MDELAAVLATAESGEIHSPVVVRAIKTARRGFDGNVKSVDHFTFLAVCLHIIGCDESAIVLLNFVLKRVIIKDRDRRSILVSIAFSRLGLAQIYLSRGEVELAENLMVTEEIAPSGVLENYANPIRELLSYQDREVACYEKDLDTHHSALIDVLYDAYMEVVMLTIRQQEYRDRVSGKDESELVAALDHYKDKLNYYLVCVGTDAELKKLRKQ